MQGAVQSPHKALSVSACEANIRQWRFPGSALSSFLPKYFALKARNLEVNDVVTAQQKRGSGQLNCVPCVCCWTEENHGEISPK